MKSVAEIILFLIENAIPDPYVPVTRAEFQGGEGDSAWKEPRTPRNIMKKVVLRLSGARRFTVPLKDFEAFMGEPYDFEAHLRQVHEHGRITFQVEDPGGFYDTPSYREAFKHANGLVRDYKNGKNGISYLAFYICEDKKSFLEEHRQALMNLEDLGCFPPEDEEKPAWGEE